VNCCSIINICSGFSLQVQTAAGVCNRRQGVVLFTSIRQPFSKHSFFNKKNPANNLAGLYFNKSAIANFQSEILMVMMLMFFIHFNKLFSADYFFIFIHLLLCPAKNFFCYNAAVCAINLLFIFH
jgi:hypothetical protein